VTSSTDPSRNRPEDDRPEGHGPGDDPEHPHPILESFNAEQIVQSPGALDEEPSTVVEADVPPPQ
jgi:hypothetical protein